MSDLTVRALEGDDWQAFRQIRLAALQDAPDAFASSYDEEQEYDEDFWRLRLARSSRLLACLDDEPVGIVSVGDAEDEGVAELFGMWVVPQQRGRGVAWQLTEAAAEHARRQGRRALRLWVSTDNGRAVAFFSSYGFRPGNDRRPMTNDPETEEVAMVIPLGVDPGASAVTL
ncbi:MAG TPA: GNAT family N-acetyltransferase [Actinomycetales bacterium]|nr:GNAT family N-acetyltransferase [Actinomycetales bacterium]